MVMPIPKEILTRPASIIGETFNHVGDSFKEMLAEVEKINNQNGVSVQDALKLTESAFHYDYFQNVLTKIASKSANAINDVMKAQ
ncbi:EscI/YscI/HrpB family type III secretion system inner rod protein [Citrobacter portucalensis]|uniref:EscI/YscI/HrpB family type III secretion system inner rod protein n=1 Tax=Citrobacter portucalensis TaxID=1639133 RepID=UPI00226B2D0C|nr:EscI/YscI/HrpB family type III secretion system inner rod protein [Citrobacter portucalensis]MCX8986022.1 EscI/YscI/HrpB family type III secretion system inner rod protein [Citrobacter portucalensis]